MMAVISPAIEQKRRAAHYFVERLLESNVRDLLAKVILFGSVSKGTARESSDVDVLLVGTKNLDRIRDAVFDAMIETYERYQEGVESLIYPLERLRYPGSYFLCRVFRQGEEIYCMDEESVKRREVENYLQLSEEYLEGAQDAFEAKRWRIATDAGYNAAELCVKGLLLLEYDDLPTSHGGLVSEFGRLYAKTGKVPKALGRQLNQSLELRNKARYELNADIGKETAKGVLELAKELQEVLRDRMQA